MKPSLQLNISQQITLTPQLQQAIRLLQLSTLELQQEIQLAVEANPMLEMLTQEEELSFSKERLPDQGDFQWASPYTSNNKGHSFEDVERNSEQLYSTNTSLRDYLHWQLGLTPMSEIDRAIATAIIDAIGEDGFLTQTVMDLFLSLRSEEYPLEIEEIEAVRHRIQQFDPIGCASEHLAEALLVQLAKLSEEEPGVTLAKKIVQAHLPLVGQRNYRCLMKACQVTAAELSLAIKVIQRLRPKPGASIYQESTEYVIPDILVRKIEGRWQAFLNPYSLPKLSINRAYAELRGNNEADKQFLRSHLQEARWLLKTIESRQETLLKVANAIIDYQTDFFEYGPEAMKPLILNHIALSLDMHESTISRVTTQKFMHTPKGIFELKYFFSSHVATSNGGECSSTAIRAVLKKLIAAENRKKPLSDSKISELMKQQGIEVARRTVAKYREALGLPPSNERKTICSE